jgi:hypothetical protein
LYLEDSKKHSLSLVAKKWYFDYEYAPYQCLKERHKDQMGVQFFEKWSRRTKKGINTLELNHFKQKMATYSKYDNVQ